MLEGFLSNNSKLKGKLHLYLCMMTGTVMGNVARIGLETLSDYELAFIQPTTVLWANFCACLVMGFFQAMKAEPGFLDEHGALFTAIGTGFCGAFSSFSTMMGSIFEHSTSLTEFEIKHHRKLPNRAYGIMEFLSVTLVHLCMSMSALLFGRKLGSEVVVKYYSVEHTETVNDGNDDESKEGHTIIRRKPSQGFRSLLIAVDYTMTALGIPLAILLIVLAAYYNNYSRAKWTLPSLFGYYGVYLRYMLGNYFNKVIPNFPLGTFIANIFASLVDACLTLVTRGRKSHGSPLPVVNTAYKCRIVYGLTEGFCGSLSTISSFINEGYNLPFFSMLIYFGTSIAVAYILFVITLGSYAWTRGLVDPLCPA